MYSEHYDLYERTQTLGTQSSYLLMDQSILVRFFEVPPMYPEFETGPNDDESAEFWNFVVTVYLVNLETAEVKKIGYEEMKKLYGCVIDRKKRIAFWRILRHLKKMEKK